MLSEIKKLLQRVFATSQTYQSDLERYILSKRPSTTAELEYWSREFDRRQGSFYGR